MEEKVLSAEPQPDLRRRRTGSSSSWISLMGMDMRRHALRWEKTEIKKKKKEKKKKRKKRKKATILSVEATIVLAPKNQQAFKNYLLQCFQFLVSNKISSIQTDPK